MSRFRIGAPPNRREAIVLLTAALFPASANGQVAVRERLLGVILSGAARSQVTQAQLEALREGLAEQGWGDGLRIEARFDATDSARAAEAAQQILMLAPDAIVANTNIVAEEVLRRTSITPVVFMPVGDPIDSGFVESYSRPGRNATGFTDFEPSHAGKWLSLLREMSTDMRRACLMFNPDTAPRNGWFYLTDFSYSAPALGLEPIAMRVRDASDIEPLLSAQARMRGTGLVVAPDAFTMVNRTPVIETTRRLGVPAIYPYSAYADEGGLIAYSIDERDVFRRGGNYTGRILNGEHPSELPVQAPVDFELVVNLRTASDLGITVPIIVLAAADRVIE